LIDSLNATNNVVLDVNAIRFDTDSGFDVTDLGAGEVKIGMNSTFKFWEVAGQDPLIAVGLDHIEFIPGNNITITLDPNSPTQSIRFDAIAYTGSQGDTGPIGYTGSRGEEGYTGSRGVGFTGSQGITGFVGSQGDFGYTGSRGNTGFVGSQGIPGEFAALGYTGSKGDIGFTGSIGGTGFVGSRGGIGFTGSIGYSGSIGFTGSKGDAGTSVQITGSATTVSTLPNPYTGAIGDGYLTQDDGHLHVWTGAIWVDVGVVRGPKGDTGYTGSGGSGGGGGIILGGSPNLDGGYPDTNYGGITAIDGGGVSG